MPKIDYVLCERPLSVFIAYGTLHPLVAIHSNRLLSFKFLNLVLREVFKLKGR